MILYHFVNSNYNNIGIYMNQFNILATFNDINNAIEKLNDNNLPLTFINTFSRVGDLPINDLNFFNQRINNNIAYYDNRHRLAYLNGLNYNNLTNEQRADMRGCVNELLNDINLELNEMINFQNNNINYNINNNNLYINQDNINNYNNNQVNKNH